MSEDLLTRYQNQYIEFATLNDFTLESRAKQVPAEKHFWVCRLIDAKILRDKLLKQKVKTKKSLEQKLAKESPVILTRQIMEDLDNTPTLETLNQEIKNLDYLIEYLEHLVKSISFIAQDIKNIIEIKKLETT